MMLAKPLEPQISMEQLWNTSSRTFRGHGCHGQSSCQVAIELLQAALLQSLALPQVLCMRHERGRSCLSCVNDQKLRTSG